MPKQSVTLAICTRNRAASLAETLASVGRVTVPEGIEAEVLVVDNGSSDETRAVVESAGVARMPVRYVLEPGRGKSAAYNRMIQASRGEVLLCTDDDVRVPEDWISGMCGPILDGRVDAVAGGVEVAPHLLRPWMEPQHLHTFASTEWMRNTDMIVHVGANMAFTRSILNRIPSFDCELGPGLGLGMMEDALFSRQVVEAGFRSEKRLDVEIEHHFDPSRLLRSSFLKAAASYGRSEAYVAHHWEHRRIDRLRWKATRASLRLGFHRLRHRADCDREEGIAWWEYGMVREEAFLRQMVIESKRPRNYDLRGLVKRGHGQAAPTQERRTTAAVTQVGAAE